MSRFIFPLFLATLLLHTPAAQAQNYGATFQASAVRFNNAGEPNTGTLRILLAVEEGVNWSTANSYASNYDLSQNPLFRGLQNLPAPAWRGLANIESQAKNDAVLQLVQSRHESGSWWFGIVAPDDGAENYWVRTRDNVKVWNGRDGNAANAINGVYTNWYPGEPNNSGGTEWAGVFYGRYPWSWGESNAHAPGTWNDGNASNDTWYLVEIDLGIDGLLEVDRSVTPLILNPATGGYFLRGPDAMTWSAAKTYAEMRAVNGIQGRLAVIPDKATNSFLASLGGGWTGLTDSENFGGTETGDGNVPLEERKTSPGWVWSGPNGSAVSIRPTDFLAWADPEPNGGYGENFVHLHGFDSRTWNDASSTHQDRPLVEFAGLTAQRNILVEQIGGTDSMAIFRNVQPTSSGYYAAINFNDPEGRIDLTGCVPYPGDTDGDDDHFVIRATTRIYIPEPGTYTFGSRHDDEILMYIDRGAAPGQLIDWGGSNANTREVTFDAAGYYSLTMFQHEGGGGAGVNLVTLMKTGFGDDRGGYDAMMADGAQLIGDTLNGGLTTLRTSGLATDNKGFTVSQVQKPGGGPLRDYAEMDEILANGNVLAIQTGVEKINYGLMESDGTVTNQGYFHNDAPFPCGYETNSFVLQALATLVVPEAGWYTFGNHSDDGFMLSIDGASFVGDLLWGAVHVENGILYANDPNNPVTPGGGSIYLAAGLYNLDYRFWEYGGGEYCELWWAAGRWTEFNESFQLLSMGTYDSSTSVPEPATWVMMLLGVAGMLVYRRL